MSFKKSLSKKIEITPRSGLIFLGTVLFSANTLLFVLRQVDIVWWSGNQSIYSNVEFFTHFRAYLSFVFVYFSYFFVAYIIFRPTRYGGSKKLPFFGISLIIVFLIISYAAYFRGLGVAGGIKNTSSFAFFFLYLFSYKSLFYVYSIKESSKIRLFSVTLFFILVNVLQGWAGFIVYLLLIYLIRLRYIRVRNGLLVFLVLLLIVPVLLTVRVYFRHYGLVDSNNFSLIPNVENIGDYIFYSVQSLLTRLDFYSNYIGINQFSPSLFQEANICYPLQQNIIYVFLVKTGLLYGCNGLGSYLPSYLYSFFEGSGTAFAVGSGYMALPYYISIFYFLQYIILISCSCFLIRFFVPWQNVRIIFVYILFIRLFQGWPYPFVQSLTGLLIGAILVRGLVFAKNRTDSQCA